MLIEGAIGVRRFFLFLLVVFNDLAVVSIAVSTAVAVSFADGAVVVPVADGAVADGPVADGDVADGSVASDESVRPLINFCCGAFSADAGVVIPSSNGIGLL